VRNVLALLLALAAGCGGNHRIAGPIIPTEPLVIRQGNLSAPHPSENTPVVFHGQMLLVTGNLSGHGLTSGFDIVDFSSQQLIQSVTVAQHFETVSAIVVDDVLYVFGSTMIMTNGGTALGGTILMVSSAVLVQWTSPVIAIKTSLSMGIGNTSVTAAPGGYVMAHDCLTGIDNYRTCFEFSLDLVTWTPAGSMFDPNEYSTSPTIRYLDGQYYLFVARLIQNGPVYPYYVTYIYRSTDLVTWERSHNGYAAISPMGDQLDGSATTDLDLVEFAGHVYITYLSGDQATWGLMRYATFQGTLAQFVELFF